MSSLNLNTKDLTTTANLNLSNINPVSQATLETTKKTAEVAAKKVTVVPPLSLKRLERQITEGYIDKNKLIFSFKKHVKVSSESESISSSSRTIETSTSLSRRLSDTALWNHDVINTPICQIVSISTSIVNQDSSLTKIEKKMILLLLTMNDEDPEIRATLNTVSPENLLLTFTLLNTTDQLFQNIHKALILIRASRGKFDKLLLRNTKNTLLRFTLLFVQSNLYSNSLSPRGELSSFIRNKLIPFAQINGIKTSRELCLQIGEALDNLNLKKRNRITVLHKNTPPVELNLTEFLNNSKINKELFIKTAVDFSRDLTSFMQSSLGSVGIEEFLINPLDEDFFVRASHWAHHIENVNLIKKYISHLLEGKVTDVKGKDIVKIMHNRIAFFTFVAKECLKIHNFESAFAIYVALQEPLSTYSADINKKTLEILNELDNIFSIKENFNNYRSLTVSNNEFPSVLLASILSKDITFAIDGNKMDSQKIYYLARILKRVSTTQKLIISNENFNTTTNLETDLANFSKKMAL